MAIAGVKPSALDATTVLALQTKLGVTTKWNSIKDAAWHGFVPTATAAVNTVALQAAILGGNCTVFVKAGTYEINDTILIDDNTTIIFEVGAILKKVLNGVNHFSQVFLNRGALTRTYNSNITIDGLTLLTNGVGVLWDNIRGLSGNLGFYFVKKLTIKNFTCTDGGLYLFMIVVCKWEDIYFDNIKITSLKDALSFQTGHDGFVNNVIIETKDDGIGLKTVDYPDHEVEAGDIYNLTFNNIVDRNPGGQAESGCAIDLLLGSWTDWTNGFTYWSGDHCLNAGHLYFCDTGAGFSAVGSVGPTHHTGIVTGADGIPWRYECDSTSKFNSVYNIVFNGFKVTKNRPGGIFFTNMCSGTAPSSNRGIYPGTEGTSFVWNVVMCNGVFVTDPAKQVALVVNSGGLKNINISNNIIDGIFNIYSSPNSLVNPGYYLSFLSYCNINLVGNNIKNVASVTWSLRDREDVYFSSAGNIKDAGTVIYVAMLNGSTVRWSGSDLPLRNGALATLTPVLGDLVLDVNGLWVYDGATWNELSA